MIDILHTNVPDLYSILAQTSIPGIPPTQQLFSDFLGSLFNFGKALLFLIGGWIIASIARGIIQSLLNRTNLDNRIFSWIGGQQRTEAFPIERWIGALVYWTILLFAFVAFLQALQLDAVSEPLNSLLTQITNFLPKILGAAFLLGIAWVIATLVKTIVTRVLGGLRIDERLGQQLGDNSLVLSNTIGNALYWFIFLLFLPSILTTLQLKDTLDPVQNLLDDILGILPNVFAAVLIGAVGWLIAQIVRRLVTNLLAATGVDRIGERAGLSRTSNTQSLSWILGTIVYVLVLIPAAIAALNALEIRAISVPAVSMLQQVLDILPKLFAAGVVMALAYIAGQYVSELITGILTGIGFNNILQWLGISRTSTTPSSGEPKLDTEQPTLLQSNTVTTRTPSELVGLIARIAILLVASLTAVDILQIEALRAVVGVILVIAGQVFLGLIVFAIGLYLANLAYNLIASTGTRQAKILGQTARVSIIALISAMALQQMNVAPNIINLAFGLLLGSIAVAIALAFGLGGRDIAAEQVRGWLESFKKD